jgi:chitinase
MTRVWLVLLVGVALLSGVTASGADFTASTPTPASFAAAGDFNTVAVALTDPGTPLHGTVALQATASSDREIDRVRFQSSPAGAGTWGDICQDTDAPYSCDFDTAGVADGSRDLRAVAVDQAGYQRTSVVAARLVDNTAPSAAVTDPGPWLQGAEDITATATDAGSGLATLAIEHRAAGGGAWTELCTGSSSPRTCSLATASLPDGDHELRARAVDTAGNVRHSTPLVRRVDNTAPTVSIPDPGVLHGTISVLVNAADGAGTGIASVSTEFRQGAGAWMPVCTDTTAPYTCDGLDTTQVTDGLYEARATAVDGTGLSTTSAPVNVRVDNGAPTATLVDPGTPLQGSVALTGTAVDGGSGIVSWTVQRRPAGGGAWTDICSDTVAPFTTCSWNTTGVADALYDLRAVGRDAAGNEGAATTVANRRVDNNGPTVTLNDPGSPIRGTVTLTASASDPVGVQSVVFERKLTSGSTWTTICTDTISSYSCSFNTSALNGTYDLRARAIDTLTHTSSSTVAARVIDNTAPTGTDVQAGNAAGGTAGRFGAGDWIRLTWSEPIAPGSVLNGWTGGSVPITVRVSNDDRMDFYDEANNARLDLVNAATDLPLNRNFVSGNKSFGATMAQSGNSITITFGTVTTSNLNTATAGTMTWRPSSGASDLAGNASTTTTVTESGAPADVDF